MKRLYLALAVLAALIGGCGDQGSRRTAHIGDTWVLLTREAALDGLSVRRETWTLADTAAGQGHYRVQRAGREPSEAWRPLAGGLGGARRGRRSVSEQLERVDVPAGTFPCRRSVRTQEESNGRVMRVDEWWAAGVPVPVQRWTRWQGLPDPKLHTPPQRASDLVLGSEWTVLERAPRR